MQHNRAKNDKKKVNEDGMAIHKAKKAKKTAQGNKYIML